MNIASKKLLVSAVFCSAVMPLVSFAKLDIKLGGHLDVMAGGRSQSLPYNYLYSSNPLTLSKKAIKKSLITDGSITINVDSEKSDNFKYGALLYINANTSASTQGENGVLNKSMVYFESSKIGRFEAGNYYGAGAMFEMIPTNFTKAGYGVNGYWSAWVNNAAYVDVESTVIGGAVKSSYGTTKVIVSDMMPYKYLYSPSLPSNYSGKYYATAPKVTYYTIPYPGITLGISYIPDLDSTGAITTQAPDNSGPVDSARYGSRPTFKHIFSGGVMYEKKLHGLSIKASASGEVGKAKHYYNTNLVNDLKAYELGLGVNYGEYGIGFSYGDWGKTGTYRKKFAGTKQGANYWTAVVSQQKENLAYSLSYMQSKKAGGLEAIGSNLQVEYAKALGINVSPGSSSTFSDTRYNVLKVVSLGVDYKLAPGMMSYLEGTRFVFKNKNDLHSNKGFVVLSGVRLSF